jgi:hypothetical protein
MTPQLILSKTKSVTFNAFKHFSCKPIFGRSCQILPPLFFHIPTFLHWIAGAGAAAVFAVVFYYDELCFAHSQLFLTAGTK